MSHSIFGQVVGVRKYANGDIEIDFYHDDDLIEYRYSSDPSNPGSFPKEIAETLARTLATNVCAELYFGDDGLPTHVELEECDYDDEEFEEDEEL